MCGISGMLGNPDNSVVHRMVSVLNHRGPDGSGHWNDENISLGHSRLSIVDLSGSRQPIIGNNGTVLVANGEIYNYLEIRRQLNYQWTTSGDSEVISALYESSMNDGHPKQASFHASWIKKLDGMFAFALWDYKNRQLILSRDSMGIKPLVRTNVGKSLLFASEIKAFWAHEEYNPKLDESALAMRLCYEYTLDRGTLIENVHQVRPGTVEVWAIQEDGSPILTSVASFERQQQQPEISWNPDRDSPKLLESFISGVQQRLMSDVPVGIVLSGGLDSSLVAAVANEAANRESKPTPDCWTVSESEDNPDWLAAEEVASSLDIRHHQKIMSDKTFIDELPSLSYYGEDLDVSVMFFQPLFREMSKSVKVGLCGQGADELHAGYPRYKDLTQYNATVASRINALDESVKHSLFAKKNNPSSFYDSKIHPDFHTNNLNDLLQFELERGQLSNFQLRLVDRHSMANSLEVRVPFLAKQHRQQSYSLPEQWKLPKTGLEKAALRCASRLTNLPKSITDRPKLPAGTATSPNLYAQFVDEFMPRAKAISNKYSKFGKVLDKQPEIAIGLGLFEAIHLIDGGISHNKSVAQLIDGVL